MPAIEMKNITKVFNGVKANNAVNLKVHQGSIHALVGENGAGKSTLMKILYGMYRPEEGAILVRDTPVKFYSSSDAIRNGIGMVHQHFMLVPTLTVTDNIILGQEPTFPFFKLDLKKANEEILRLSKDFSLTLPLTELTGTLSVGMQQRIEILKILYRNADVLIFDEPTAVLAPQEVEALFSTMRRLKSQGKTIILITHKVSEIMGISDYITVMRSGKISDEFETPSTTGDAVVRSMIGQNANLTLHKTVNNFTETILMVKNLSANNEKKIPLLKDVSFSVKSGEVFGIAGVEGNGQSSLVEVLTGLRNHHLGTIELNGNNINLRRDTSTISHIPEDRHARGLILDFPLSSNIILGRQRDRRFGNIFTVHKNQICEFAKSMVKLFDIRPPAIDQPVRGYSGGNQQKIVIARELSKNADLIIANQPTRGLDIGATAFVHQSLLDQRNKGKGILLISSDLSELLSLSDRIGVMFEGEIIAIFESSKCSELDLGAYMTGAYKKSA
jgi:simple sugar transport system ATP-binding protein